MVKDCVIVQKVNFMGPTHRGREVQKGYVKKGTEVV